ncbi:SDR family oxidoreductase [Jeotgalibacillus terrae]|uniref:SDR family oxidoreductase n=1 Tax=Jeotgalibacillus terrae TaxID=587735 RepID=A0ABW5ZCX9_9BACL|nr:SDR family oxidoreductase [Jeotgalibacillus terrae]MBM7579175.1 3-oxoacyl-[acyl-carrier protein] reductase [Jeotgalibacillus terrae]
MTRRLAIITGVGRKAGIGASIAEKLAADGMDILFTFWHAYDRDVSSHTESEDPDDVLAACRAHGVQAEMIELNLAEVHSIDELFSFCQTAFGRYPDTLIQSAAVSINDSIETISADQLDQHYAINTRAVTLLTQKFLQHFDSETGRVICLTTGWAQGPMPNELSYALTKSAIDTLVYTISPVLAERKITINSINPGPTDSGWMNDEVKKELLSLSPQGRLGMPADAANLVSFLASEQAQWITGQTIHSEGGFINFR